MPLLDVKIPPMGESISSGVLAKWHVKDGDVVKKAQPLFELETDKITSEGTAEAAGKILSNPATSGVPQHDVHCAAPSAMPAWILPIA